MMSTKITIKELKKYSSQPRMDIVDIIPSGKPEKINAALVLDVDNTLLDGKSTKLKQICLMKEAEWREILLFAKQNNIKVFVATARTFDIEHTWPDYLVVEKVIAKLTQGEELIETAYFTNVDPLHLCANKSLALQDISTRYFPNDPAVKSKICLVDDCLANRQEVIMAGFSAYDADELAGVMSFLKQYVPSPINDLEQPSVIPARRLTP